MRCNAIYPNDDIVLESREWETVIYYFQKTDWSCQGGGKACSHMAYNILPISTNQLHVIQFG